MAAGADNNGRAAIEWGVYGVPETFIIGRDGRIAYKLVGPITPDNLDRVDQAGDREGARRRIVAVRAIPAQLPALRRTFSAADIAARRTRKSAAGSRIP